MFITATPRGPPDLGNEALNVAVRSAIAWMEWDAKLQGTLLPRDMHSAVEIESILHRYDDLRRKNPQTIDKAIDLMIASECDRSKQDLEQYGATPEEIEADAAFLRRKFERLRHQPPQTPADKLAAAIEESRRLMESMGATPEEIEADAAFLRRKYGHS